MLSILQCFFFSAQAADKRELWVYTSIYKEFAAPIEKAFEAKYPDIDVQIYQAGSEKIQSKIEAELSAGKPQADLVLVSNPFWGLELEARKLLHVRPGKGAYQKNYFSMTVIVANSELA